MSSTAIDNNYGWICPKCQTAWAPSVHACHCQVKVNIPPSEYGTSISPSIDKTPSWKDTGTCKEHAGKVVCENGLRHYVDENGVPIEFTFIAGSMLPNSRSYKLYGTIG